MRQFSAEYLRSTRRGMWADSREALKPLSLSDRQRVLDVGAGTGELTAVLRSETHEGTPVVAVDADRSLLETVPPPRALGDATTLGIRDDAVDLAGCQALLVNLPEPSAAVREFAGVSEDLVAAIEPDNGEVSVESTVDAEAELAGRAREHYLSGVSTDATLGAVPDLFREVGLDAVAVERYDHVTTVEPPYDDGDLEAARRKASGEGLAADRGQILDSGVSEAGYDALREEWREMGRAAVEQMQTDDYRRREVVPFYVTVGRVHS